jgi:hypothetical protein
MREGWDRSSTSREWEVKSDTEDEFEGASFRDPKTKLLFAYDLKNRFTLRIWGTTSNRPSTGN